jgi:hypothetical protein
MSELTKQALKVDNNQSFPNNNAGLITPTALRTFNENMIDSTVNQQVYTTDSASFDNRIDALSGSVAVNTGSFLITASAVDNVMTFTKGDSSTFNVTVGSVLPSGLVSGSSQIDYPQISNIPSGIVSGSSQITSLGFVSSSITGSSLVTASFAAQTLTFTKGDGAQFSLFIPDNSGSVIPSGVVSSSQQITELGFQTTASFNTYTSSNDSKVNSLINATSSYATSAITGSSLITASFSGNTLTFTKGDSSTFGIVIPDVSGSTINTGSFATTGSNTFIGDQTISGSLFVSGSEVLTGTLSASALRVENNTYLDGTLTVTNDTLINGDVTIQSATPNLKLRDTSGGGFSSGYDIRVDTGSFEIYDDTHNRDVLSDFFNSGSQKHTTSLTSEIIVISGSDSVTLIGNVSASVISASVITGLGSPAGFSASVDSRLNNIELTTASLQTEVDGLSNATSSYALSASVAAVDAAQQLQIDSLISATGSYITSSVDITSLNTFTQSAEGRLNNLELTTQSLESSVNQLNSATSSYAISSSVAAVDLGQQLQIDSLIAATSSYVTSAITASSLITASFSGNTLTFTKGDSSTFGVVIPDVSGSVIPAGTISGSSQVDYPFISNIPAGIISSSQQLPSGVVSGSTQIIELGFQTTSSFNAYTASQSTGSFATTGSNLFIGNQTITGSLILSSSAVVELQVIGNSVFTGSAFGNVVALSITSNTASIDLNTGNYFTLSIPTGSTRISPSNIQAGTSATLVITTASGSLVTFDSSVKQPSGSAYVPTSGSIDILSFVSIASSSLFVVSTKNMI